jgi:hypothetical protein
MALTDWMTAFERAQASDLTSDLERAYEAALLIQGFELEYYNDRPVRPELELGIPRQIQAQMLRSFKSALKLCRSSLEELEQKRGQLDGQEHRQLQLIESVVARYGRTSPLPSMSRSPNVLPSSFLNVFDGVRRQLDPEAEATIVAGFRRRRDSTLVSLRILLLLILVPLLIQQMSRNLVVSPLVDLYSKDMPILSYPQPHLQQEAIRKLRFYQSEVEFEALLAGATPPSRDQMQAALAEKAEELRKDADRESNDAIKNIISDALGFCSFVLVCFFGKRDIQVLKGFLDEVLYGLSDSAKAFTIILFTDIFVGFHSPEGWTVLLEGVEAHFGIAHHESFIMLFIATFPVVLATILKYWIFRYLNRVSPSSVATLHSMNGGS